MKMARNLTCFACLLLAFAAQAQWGVQGTVLHWEALSPRGFWFVRAGVDHDVNERGSLGVDYALSIDLFGAGQDGETGTYQGNSVYYVLNAKAQGLTLRSAYHFSDNDEASFYFGPFAGFRTVEYEVRPDDFNAPFRNETGSGTLFNLGFKLGYRGALDGFFSDVHVGYGTNFGNLDLVKAPYLDKKDMLGRGFFLVGYSWGIGWD